MNDWQTAIAEHVAEAQRDAVWKAAMGSTESSNLHFSTHSDGALYAELVYYNAELDFPDNPFVRIEMSLAARQIIDSYRDRYGVFHAGEGHRKHLAALSARLKAAAAEIDEALT